MDTWMALAFRSGKVYCAAAGLLAIVVPFLLQLSMGEVDTEIRMLSRRCWEFGHQMLVLSSAGRIWESSRS